MDVIPAKYINIQFFTFNLALITILNVLITKREIENKKMKTTEQMYEL